MLEEGVFIVIAAAGSRRQHHLGHYYSPSSLHVSESTIMNIVPRKARLEAG